MQAIVCHKSALAFLDKCSRLVPPPGYRIKLKEFDQDGLTRWACTKHQLASFDLGRFERPGMPLDILIPSYSHLHNPKGIKLHAVGGTLPEGSLLDAGAEVLICSAPLAFVQICRNAPLDRCIKLGCFICGTYSLEPSAKSGTVKRRPLTTPEELGDFMARARHLRGSRKAAAALHWIHSGSASPQETNLALPFYLPARMDGYGFVPPMMNYKIPLGGDERAIEGSLNVKIDVYWPDWRIGFEYNSYAEHSKVTKIGEDERRALVLHKKRIHVELVTNEQLEDRRQMDILAQMLDEYGVPRIP